jgi:hypothetical protein
MLKNVAAGLVVVSLLSASAALWLIADSSRQSADAARHAAFCAHVESAVEVAYANPIEIGAGARTALSYLTSLPGTPYDYTVQSVKAVEAVWTRDGSSYAAWQAMERERIAEALYGVGC